MKNTTKEKRKFVCRVCGNTFIKFLGKTSYPDKHNNVSDMAQCPRCGNFAKI